MARRTEPLLPLLFEAGANGGQTISVDFGNATNAAVASTSGLIQDVNSAAATITAGTTASAMTKGTSAVTAIDTAITNVNTQRPPSALQLISLLMQLTIFSNVKVNSEAARSRVLDTDYAAATSELARTQIIQQAGTAMLAQANQLLKQYCLCFNEQKLRG